MDANTIIEEYGPVWMDTALVVPELVVIFCSNNLNVEASLSGGYRSRAIVVFVSGVEPVNKTLIYLFCLSAKDYRNGHGTWKWRHVKFLKCRININAHNISFVF